MMESVHYTYECIQNLSEQLNELPVGASTEEIEHPLQEHLQIFCRCLIRDDTYLQFSDSKVIDTLLRLTEYNHGRTRFAEAAFKSLNNVIVANPAAQATAAELDAPSRLLGLYCTGTDSVVCRIHLLSKVAQGLSRFIATNTLWAAATFKSTAPLESLAKTLYHAVSTAASTSCNKLLTCDAAYHNPQSSQIAPETDTSNTCTDLSLQESSQDTGSGDSNGKDGSRTFRGNTNLHRHTHTQKELGNLMYRILQLIYNLLAVLSERERVQVLSETTLTTVFVPDAVVFLRPALTNALYLWRRNEECFMETSLLAAHVLLHWNWSGGDAILIQETSQRLACLLYHLLSVSFPDTTNSTSNNTTDNRPSQKSIEFVLPENNTNDVPNRSSRSLNALGSVSMRSLQIDHAHVEPTLEDENEKWEPRRRPRATSSDTAMISANNTSFTSTNSKSTDVRSNNDTTIQNPILALGRQPKTNVDTVNSAPTSRPSSSSSERTTESDVIQHDENKPSNGTHNQSNSTTAPSVPSAKEKVKRAQEACVQVGIVLASIQRFITTESAACTYFKRVIQIDHQLNKAMKNETTENSEYTRNGTKDTNQAKNLNSSSSVSNTKVDLQYDTCSYTTSIDETVISADDLFQKFQSCLQCSHAMTKRFAGEILLQLVDRRPKLYMKLVGIGRAMPILQSIGAVTIDGLSN